MSRESSIRIPNENSFVFIWFLFWGGGRRIDIDSVWTYSMGKKGRSFGGLPHMYVYNIYIYIYTYIYIHIYIYIYITCTY